MDLVADKIAEVVGAVNDRFYRSNFQRFDATRQRDWSGWLSLIEELPEGLVLNVLDLGCGNGRFAGFLSRSEQLSNRVMHFTGVDRSQELLALASSQEFAFETEWRAGDFFSPSMPAGVNLITAFGVFHHIFSYQRRLAFLWQNLDNLGPDGRLWVSLWDFARDIERRAKFLDRDAVCKDLGIDVNQLEAHDYFLGFGQNKVPRFCHWVCDSELLRLKSDLRELANGRWSHCRLVVEELRRPNDLNHYLKFRKESFKGCFMS